MSTRALLSVEQFVAMPEDERAHFELVEGELFPVSSPTAIHALVLGEIDFQLQVYLKRHQTGIVVRDVDCRTAADTVRRPDYSYFSRERWQLLNPRKVPLPFPPDIAVEVLSPGESAIDVNKKVHEYLGAGAQEVWIVDTESREFMIRTNAEVRIVGSGAAITSPLLPGFSLSASNVFEKLSP